MQNVCSVLIGKGGPVLYLTVCQQLKHLSKDEFLILRELCRTAKNLTNQAIYQIRQHYFEHSQYLPYEKNYAILKTSENYRLLNSNMAQQILKEVDGAFKFFFSLLKLAKQGKYPFSSFSLA
jgi:transposase IS200/IS605 family